MQDTLRTQIDKTDIEDQSAVSWAAVAAGGLAAAALTLVLLAFGAGMGFSAISPWSNSGVSSGAFKVGAGIYLIVVAMLSSTVGGYVAGRLRTKWTGLRTDEVAFRDTAHGFLAWGFATVLGAAALSGAATYLVGGAATGAAQGASQGVTNSASTQGGNGYFVDMLLRPDPARQGAPGAASPQAGNDEAARGEIGRIFARSLRAGSEFSPADLTYVTQIVAARTGVNQADEKRVAEVIYQAKATADDARRAAAKAALWLTAAMLIGAFAASLAAVEGGQLRDGTWRGVIGARNYRARQRP
jgi:hypothetical protein